MRTRRKLLVLLLSAGTVLGYAHGIHSLKRLHRGQCHLSQRGAGLAMPAETYGGYAETDGSSHPGFGWFGGRHHGHGHHGHGRGHGHGQGQAQARDDSTCGCAQGPASGPASGQPTAVQAQPVQVVCPTPVAVACAMPAAPLAYPQPVGGLGGLPGAPACAPAGAVMMAPAAPAGVSPGLRDPFDPATPARVPYAAPPAYGATR
jgi:hypothetical protein